MGLYSSLFCCRFLDKYSKYLPPTHFNMCEMKGVLAQKIGGSSLQQLQTLPLKMLVRKIDLNREILQIYETIAPGEIVPPLMVINDLQNR